jgi:hypothetical protein
MADRFYGTVYLGGRLTQEQFDKCKELLEPCLDDELDDDGSGAFIECTCHDFDDIVDFCKSNGIALSLHWDAKWEQDSSVDYWVNGEYKQFFAAGDGDIAVRLAELQEHPEMTIAEFIAKMDIPDFPAFEIVESSTPQPA